MNRRKIGWHGYLAGGCLGLIVLLVAMTGLLKKADLGFYDTWFNVRGKECPGNKIVIVAIDERSISKLGPLPWSRKVHAHLLDKLRQAKAVSFDVLFDAPTNKKADDALAKAISKHQRVVLASMFTFEQEKNGEWYQQLKMPIPEFLEGAAGIGFINMPADKGNIIRRVTVADTNMFERPFPSLSLATTMVGEKLNPGDLNLKNGLLNADKLRIPLNDAHQVMIDFWGPGRTFPTLSYVDVTEGQVKPNFWKDKIVLVGIATPTEKKDIYENPFTKGNLVLSNALPVPGIEIHASAIKTYQTSRYFHQASWPINLAFLVLVWLATMVAARLKPWTGLFFAFLLALAIVVLVYVLWLKMHYWLNITAPLAMVAVTYLGTTVENFVRTEMERRRTRSLFSRYLSPAVVEELLQQGKKIELGGIRQEVTILFADIRGFTAFSEGKSPEIVVTHLNEYFTSMTEVIFRHGGTLDKYLGDGLMATFGVPVAYPDHANRAVAAAMEMLVSLEELNQRWQEKSKVIFNIGIGINSGSVVVGNIGSLKRMEYTVIGEEVNLASRLEAINKEYNTQIILSERTRRYLDLEKLPPSQVLKDLGEVKVRGSLEPVKIYTLTSQKVI